MVRTRGRGLQGDHVRPITSVSRRRHVNEDEKHIQHEVEEAQPHMEVENECELEVEYRSYPRCLVTD